MDTPLNRLAGQRGRPAKDALAAPPVEKPVEEVDVPVRGIVCLACGRAMVPRVTHSEPRRRHLTCTLCGRRMSITITTEHPKGTIRLL